MKASSVKSVRCAIYTNGLVAAALLARDRAAIVPFNRGSLHAAALSWADGNTTGAVSPGKLPPRKRGPI